MSLTGKGSGIAQSLLTQPVQQDNFVAIQSGQIDATTSSSSITFTALNIGTIRTSAIIANTGTVAAYLASGSGSATAVASSTTPQPAASSTAVANCFCIPPGAIYTLGFEQGTNTFAAITASGSTTLEISVGYGS